VQNLDDVALVFAGAYHTCALQTDGTAWCWGYNQYGQLGNENRVQQIAPGRVIGVSSTINMAPGASHTCSVGNTGQVACWGRATHGQLGDGLPQQGLRSSAGLVVGLTSVAQASSGGHHTCVAGRNGQLACWGFGFFGQLGNDSFQNAARPVNVPATGTVTHLSAGTNFTVVATTDGQVRCWGADLFGQCAQGSASSRRRAPVPVGGIEGVIEVAAGGEHACARNDEGKLYCWGNNNFGQLGLDDQAVRFTPVEVTRF
jgi:alpha-tubulin suppressor-like RCC1 family protein